MAESIEEKLLAVQISELRLEECGPVGAETPVSEIYERLDRQRCNAAVICDGDLVIGIFTQRDILNRTALEAPDPATPIRELMTSDPFTLRPDQKLADAIHAMTVHGYRNVPLVDGSGRWQGLLASRDVLRYIAAHFPEAVLNLPPRLDQQLATPEGG